MMTADQLQELSSVQEKQDWSKDQTLSHSVQQLRWHGTGHGSTDLLYTASQI